MFDQPAPKQRSIDAIGSRRSHGARFLLGIKLIRACADARPDASSWARKLGRLARGTNPEWASAERRFECTNSI